MGIGTRVGLACIAMLASGVLIAPEPAAAKEPVALASSYYLGGRAKLSVKRIFGARPMVTWRVSIDGDTFALHGLATEPITGTFVRKGGTGKKLVLTIDEASLQLLGDGLAHVGESLGAPEDLNLSVTRVRAQIVVGKTPDRSKLKMKLSLEGAVDDGKTQRGLFKLNGKGVSRRVIVLDDDRSAPQVLEALRRKRISAFSVGYYELWDGLDPPLAETDVVLFLQGYEYDASMIAEADQALVAFVDAGGLLVRTEWCAYEVGDDASTLAIDAYLPVRAPESDYLEGEICSWTVQDRSHPLTKGLRENFDIDGAGFSFVVAEPGATVLATNQRDEPTLAIQGFGPGEVVHINNDLTYAVDEIPPEILRVLVNCANYGLRR